MVTNEPDLGVIEYKVWRLFKILQNKIGWLKSIIILIEMDRLSVSLYVCLSVRLSAHLSDLSIHTPPTFPLPTSQHPIPPTLYPLCTWRPLILQALIVMGLDVRKPVFGGLRTTQAQTRLRIRAVWSAPLLFVFWKVSYIYLLHMKFQFSS